MEIVVLVGILCSLAFLIVLADKYFSYRIELAEKQAEFKINQYYSQDLEEFKAMTNDRFDAVLKKIQPIEDLKSRVDTLSLKAGFKL